MTNNAKPPKVCLHIGMQKTGTTFIQNCVLPAFGTTCKVLNGRSNHREIISTKSNQQLIISDESLSGYLVNGAYFESFVKSVNRIKEYYNDPKIIFGVRRQNTFILSVYKKFLHEGSVKDLEQVYNLNNTGLLKDEDLNYLKRIMLLKENFSEVFIYTQESLKENLSGFLNALGKFLEVDEIGVDDLHVGDSNVGVKTTFQVNLLKSLNRINHLFIRTRVLPNLYSKVFKKLGISPRAICQYHLNGFGNKEFILPKELEVHLTNSFNEDWENIQPFISF